MASSKIPTNTMIKSHVINSTLLYVFIFLTFLGIFIDEENLQIFSDLTNTFINQANQSAVSISAHFYNETEPLILDDTYITRGKFKKKSVANKNFNN